MVVLAVVGSIYAGVLAGSVVVHGWSVHLAVAAAFAPAVAALWWRRSRPLLVLAIATAGILLAYPMDGRWLWSPSIRPHQEWAPPCGSPPGPWSAV